MNRRRFLESAAALTGGVLVSQGFPAANAAEAVSASKPAKRSATDMVMLGKSGVKCSRIGIGTGSNSGDVQRSLGREGFNRLIQYAYDQGITFIDTAESYHNHDWIKDAIKGLPRERLHIQTKMSGAPEKPLDVLDRFRKELNTDYVDSLLVNYATTNSWHEERKRLLDAFDEAKEKKWIRTKGVSCHGLPALTRATLVPWVEVHLVRLNPMGHKVDGKTFEWNEQGNVSAVEQEVRAMRAQGRGIIGMKLIGNGDFTKPEEREKSIRYAMQCSLLDAAIIGFKSSAEIDEAIERVNRALNEA